ncbi:hypothetical protein [Leeia sp.]|uniref:hypothetical protein n=1 Tax=Leeia sp. TaxID=2884678 RepID=UPI0035AF0F1C
MPFYDFLTKTLLILACTFVAGCATSVKLDHKQYEGDPLPNEKLVTIQHMRSWSNINAAAAVTAVDGKALWQEKGWSVLSDSGYVQILPGKHSIKVEYTRVTGLSVVKGKVIFSVDFEAGHGYTFSVREMPDEKKGNGRSISPAMAEFAIVDLGFGYDPVCFEPKFDENHRYLGSGGPGC